MAVGKPIASTSVLIMVAWYYMSSIRWIFGLVILLAILSIVFSKVAGYLVLLVDCNKLYWLIKVPD
jgi:hypothetical protein